MKRHRRGVMGLSLIFAHDFTQVLTAFGAVFVFTGLIVSGILLQGSKSRSFRIIGTIVLGAAVVLALLLIVYSRNHRVLGM